MKWQAEYMARRRARMREDTGYLEKHRARSREQYRKRVGLDITTIRDCRRKPSEIRAMGRIRPVVGMDNDVVTFDFTELAAALGGYHPQIMKRWVARHQLPAPVLVANSENAVGHARKVPVYHLEEVLAIVSVLGDHQKQNAHYRAAHTDTMEGIHMAVLAARKSIEGFGQ